MLADGYDGAARTLGDRATAVTADSPSYPERHRHMAVQIARDFGLRHEIIQTHELDVAEQFDARRLRVLHRLEVARHLLPKPHIGDDHVHLRPPERGERVVCGGGLPFREDRSRKRSARRG